MYRIFVARFSVCLEDWFLSPSRVYLHHVEQDRKLLFVRQRMAIVLLFFWMVQRKEGLRLESQLQQEYTRMSLRYLSPYKDKAATEWRL